MFGALDLALAILGFFPGALKIGWELESHVTFAIEKRDGF